MPAPRRRGYTPGARQSGGLAERLVHGVALAVLCAVAADFLGLRNAAGVSTLVALGAAAAVGVTVGLFAPAGRWPWRVLWTAGALLSALVLLVAATPVVSRALTGGLVRRDPPGEPADAVVVLSGGQTGEGLVAGQGVERLLDAMRLARDAQLPLVVTVIRPPNNRGASSLPDQRALAALAGVADLRAVDSVRTTRDEAVQVAALAAREGWRRVALVTSPLHTRRACAAFERAGLRVRCTPSRSRDLVVDGPPALFGPGDRLRAFALAIHERLGWWLYRSRGWV